MLFYSHKDGTNSYRLRENCRKSSGSVRRDRVYCCYAEKCGTERVSVLNPASFGKLVRIIFPNVQTRRLGVRGESKYHYVDLTVIEEKQQKPASMTPQLPSRPSLPPQMERPEEVLPKSSVVVPQPPVDTAVFPSPTTSFAPRTPHTTRSNWLELPQEAAQHPLLVSSVAN